jgi:hypothetical protein
LGMSTKTPRCPRSPFTNRSRRVAACGLLLGMVLGLALGCDDGSSAAGFIGEGDETASFDFAEPAEAMDDEGEPLPDLGGPDSDEGGEGGESDGETAEADICGDGLVGPTEECDIGVYELMPCEAGPGSYVCRPNCTLSDIFCGCELGTEACLCDEGDACDPGLDCCLGTGVHVCRPSSAND